MPQPTLEHIADIVLNRRQVYDLDTDSHIRQLANRLTARALFELLARTDDQSPDFASHLSALLRTVPVEGISCMIGFDSGDLPTGDDEPDTPEQPKQPSEHYLRLVFRDEQGVTSATAAAAGTLLIRNARVVATQDGARTELANAAPAAVSKATNAPASKRPR